MAKTVVFLIVYILSVPLAAFLLRLGYKFTVDTLDKTDKNND